MDIWMRDLRTGKDSPLIATPAREDRPKITPDGATVIHERWDSKNTSYVYRTAVRGGASERLCDDCRLLDLSSDGKRVLYYTGSPVYFVAYDLTNGKRYEVLRHPKYNLHRGQFSPDGNWLAFHCPKDDRHSPIYVTPLHDGKASAAESDWIEISDAEGTDKQPWWSPDGNLLYFFSDRDGFRCFWARRLDPVTKKGVGDAFGMYHFHTARRSLVPLAGYVGPALGKGKLVFAMMELRGNVWLGQLPDVASPRPAR